VVRARERVVSAQERLRAAERAAGAGAPAPERRAALAQAIALREARLRAGVLTDPPGWVRDDVAHRVGHRPSARVGLAEQLAPAYGDLAVALERQGSDPVGAGLEAVVSHSALSGDRPSRWWTPPVPPAGGPVPDRGVDLSR
jgi:hypothetical protein